MKTPSAAGGKNHSEKWKADIGVSCLCNVVLQLHYFHQSFFQSKENTLGFVI